MGIILSSKGDVEMCNGNVDLQIIKQRAAAES